MMKPSALTVRITFVNNDGTFDCIPLIGGAEIFNVKIKPKTGDLNGVYMLFKPALNSIATIAMLDDNDSSFILLKAEEYETLELITTGGFKCEIKANGDVILNGGDNHGLIKIDELIDKLNTLENRMFTHQHISAAVGVPTAPDPATNPLIVPTQRIELENNKIKH
jgi:uncharacterized protein YaaQ